MSEPSASEMEPHTTTGASRMALLANKISANTEKLEKYMREKGLPLPGFGVDAPGDFPELPEEMQTARREIMSAAKELEDLTMGPRETIRWRAWSVRRLHERSLKRAWPFVD